MSRIKPGAIWQQEKVLPYILTYLKDKIDEITPVEKIILFGSRGKIPIEQWNELKGKDWDIIVQAKCKLRNAHVLVDHEYHLDLLVLDEFQTKKFIENIITKELFPVSELEYLIIKNKDYAKVL